MAHVIFQNNCIMTILEFFSSAKMSRFPTNHPNCSNGRFCFRSKCYVHAYRPYELYRESARLTKIARIEPIQSADVENEIVFKRIPSNHNYIQNAKLPRKIVQDGSSFEAYAAIPEDVVIETRTRRAISTGFRIQSWPPNVFCHVSAIPSDAVSDGLIISPSTIEANFHGEIIFNVFNSDGRLVYIVEPGQPIAHLTFTSYAPQLKAVLATPNYSFDGERGWGASCSSSEEDESVCINCNSFNSTCCSILFSPSSLDNLFN